VPDSGKHSGAWEPLTPRGVAGFARASSNRLFLAQFLVALLAAAAVVWFLHHAWFPTVRQAILHLPDEGEVRAGKLDWRGDSPRLLAEGTFLAFSVDLNHSGELRSPAQVQVEFGKQNFFVRSLLGYVELDYPARRIVAFNREELGPWWDAWQPPLLGLAAVGVVAGLMIAWFVLATVYTLPVWVLVLFANRDLKPVECWRLAGAALLPGALLMVLGILLYDFGVVDLVGLGFITTGHLVLGWIYLFISPLFLPRTMAAKATGKNPFLRPDGG
jgi:hypothetical protein